MSYEPTIRPLEQINAWFKKGLYPKAIHFWDTFFSFWHKEDKIPMDSIDNLHESLNNKYDKSDGVALEDRVGVAEGRLDYHDEVINNIYKDLADHEERLDGHDEELSTVRGEITAGDEATLASAKGYTNERETAIMQSVDNKDTAVSRNAKEYTDARELAIMAAADIMDGNTLRSAKEYSDAIVAALVDNSPEALDTLWELADALGNDPNFATTVMAAIGDKVEKVAGKGLSTNDYTNDDQRKVTSVAENANYYLHPNDANTRHVTDSEKAAWNAKETTTGAQQKADDALTSAKSYTDTKVASVSVTVDSSLSTTSTNAVQNKVITAALNAKALQIKFTYYDWSSGTVVVAGNTGHNLAADAGSVIPISIASDIKDGDVFIIITSATVDLTWTSNGSVFKQESYDDVAVGAGEDGQVVYTGTCQREDGWEPMVYINRSKYIAI